MQPGKIYTSHIKIQNKIYSSIIEVYELSSLTSQYVHLSKIFFCVKMGKDENHWRFRRLSPLLKIKPLCRCFHFFMVSGFSASFYFLGRGRGGGAIYQVVMGNITIRMKINSNFVFDRHCTKKLVVILVQGIHYGLLRITQV